LNDEAPQDDTPQQETPQDEIGADELLNSSEPAAEALSMEDAKLRAVLEAIIYVTDEPLSLDQISIGLEQPPERVSAMLEQLTADYERPDSGLSIREVAGGYKMSTKAEHHDEVRRFVRNLNPPFKLSLAALETLAMIAYKQPITNPEIQEIRGIQGSSVLKTLIDRKLIAAAGRKKVLGNPMMYKTTREFLVQFGLKDLTELPTLKEFQELASLDTGESLPEQGELPLPEPPESASDSASEAGAE
jgi:segregation and condensation protein B